MLKHFHPAPMELIENQAVGTINLALLMELYIVILSALKTASSLPIAQFTCKLFRSPATANQ